MSVHLQAAPRDCPPFTEVWDDGLVSRDPLGFPDYAPPAAQDESVVTGTASCDGTRVVLIKCRFDRSGGTMGVVAGERIVRAFQRAADLRLPVTALVASGGARLQEGMVALTQMARTSSAVLAHQRAGLLSAAVLQPHTTGGVYASWVSQMDLRAANPGATVGFGGPRVVAEVTGMYPPPDSHTAESAYRNGLVDALTSPDAQWSWLAAAVVGPGAPLPMPEGRPAGLPGHRVPRDGWEALRNARLASRPSGLEWAAWLTDGWVELRGPDPSVRAAIVTIDGNRAVLIAMDRHARSDAAARQHVSGYQLARRAMNLAERLRLPLITLIDTPGAEPGPAAEAAGIAGEIALTLLTMAGLRVPSVALCVGEGGSGGAMAFAHADRFLMMSGSVFSVIGPEAGAAVLYRDASQAPRLSRSLRITAAELAELGVIDGVISENPPHAVRRARAALTTALASVEVGDRDRRAAKLTMRYLGGDLSAS
jgi:acyl-CoA carboxylase subunit beta